jgi:hypothetical protein
MAMLRELFEASEDLEGSEEPRTALAAAKDRVRSDAEDQARSGPV